MLFHDLNCATDGQTEGRADGPMEGPSGARTKTDGDARMRLWRFLIHEIILVASLEKRRFCDDMWCDEIIHLAAAWMGWGVEGDGQIRPLKIYQSYNR